MKKEEVLKIINEQEACILSVVKDTDKYSASVAVQVLCDNLRKGVENI